MIVTTWQTVLSTHLQIVFELETCVSHLFTASPLAIFSLMQARKDGKFDILFHMHRHDTKCQVLTNRIIDIHMNKS